MKDFKFEIGDTILINNEERIIINRYLDHGISGGVEISLYNDIPICWYVLNKPIKIGNYEFSTIEEKYIKEKRG